jgi:hypothetical protein
VVNNLFGSLFLLEKTQSASSPIACLHFNIARVRGA